MCGWRHGWCVAQQLQLVRANFIAAFRWNGFLVHSVSSRQPPKSVANRLSAATRDTETRRKEFVVHLRLDGSCKLQYHELLTSSEIWLIIHCAQRKGNWRLPNIPMVSFVTFGARTSTEPVLKCRNVRLAVFRANRIINEKERQKNTSIAHVLSTLHELMRCQNDLRNDDVDHAQPTTKQIERRDAQREQKSENTEWKSSIFRHH